MMQWKKIKLTFSCDNLYSVTDITVIKDSKDIGVSRLSETSKYQYHHCNQGHHGHCISLQATSIRVACEMSKCVGIK